MGWTGWPIPVRLIISIMMCWTGDNTDTTCRVDQVGATLPYLTLPFDFHSSAFHIMDT